MVTILVVTVRLIVRPPPDCLHQLSTNIRRIIDGIQLPLLDLYELRTPGSDGVTVRAIENSQL